MEVKFVTSAGRPAGFPVADRPEVAFAGRSNVGKSSLINTITNRKKLARTSGTPGRTQLINFFSVGENLYLVDLPGYGFARVPVSVRNSWMRLVETYIETRATLAAVVVILDIRRDPSDSDINLLEKLDSRGLTAIVVLTKADKLSRSRATSRSASLASKIESIAPSPPIVFSSKTREGRDQLWDRIDQLTGSARRL
jgi:GTP-binding protein